MTSAVSNKILFVILLLGIAVSAGFAWYTYIFTEDYLTYTQVPCDPATEQCFVFVDPECEGDECESFYKVVFAPAYLLSSCQPDEGECLLEKCSQSETCSIMQCSEESREELETEDECSL